MNPADLTTLTNASEWLGISNIPITGATQANPCVVQTGNASGVVSGMPVTITDVGGMTQLNGNTYTATVIDQTHFSIGVDATGYGAYTNGGFAGVSTRLLERLITAVSVYIQSWLNRTIASQGYVETKSGQGGPFLMLQNTPVTEVLQLIVGGLAILPRPPLSPTMTVSNFGGYVWDERRVMLADGLFPRGYNNVQVSYVAGFLIKDETQTIPSVAPYTLATLAQWSAGDRGVIYTNGAPLTLVTGTPSLGQYAVSGSVYTFAAADAGKTVAISYAYVPQDVEQAAVDMIGDWFRYRSRIGKLSEGIESQTITFTNQPITARAQGVLNQYRKVSPIQ